MNQVMTHADEYIGINNITGMAKRKFDNYINNDGDDVNGIALLMSLVYTYTGKKSYILIDEYDKFLTDNYVHASYSEIRDFETGLFSAAFKDNPHLEKALLTGVLRVSREAMMSGLNNLVVYDLFSDKVYARDFGLTKEELDALQTMYTFDKKNVTDWYNGININNVRLYNLYSVLSYIQHGEYKNFWGRSGSMENIASLINEKRKASIITLLGGEPLKINIVERISLQELDTAADDNIFYSMLLQAGYLSLEEVQEGNIGIVKIPNKELMNVWKEFILTSVAKHSQQYRTMFDRIEKLPLFDEDVEYFLSDRLSYFDLDDRLNEKLYHVFVLGLLSAYSDITFNKPPVSNQESGDGRFDIMMQRKDFCIIFEFKCVKKEKDLEAATLEGLNQIDEQRYYVSAPKDKPLIKTAIAFCGKQCKVRSRKHT
jgi:hypothetical protein